MSKKKSQGPLLYVNQPFSRTPSNHNMQEIYTNKWMKERIMEEKQQVNAVRKKISLAKK